MSFYRAPPSGVWAPAITFFDHETDTLDTDSQAAYYSYLSKTGLAGLVVLGTNAETFLLTREERKALLQTARQACGPSFPIMAGVGGHSTKQVLEFINDAADAGADYVLLLPPAYFGKQTTPEVINNFFDDVAKNSQLPIVIYNFPVVCNGIDLDSATIAALAKRHSNIVGVKLTCGAVAKITRLSAELPEERFAIYGGQSDFLIGGLAAGSHGTIAGFANVVPKTIVHIYNLYQEGKFQEAMVLHKKAALAEQPCKAGIASVKYAATLSTAKAAGIKGAADRLKPRRPYVEPTDAAKKSIESQISEMLDFEATLKLPAEKGKSNGVTNGVSNGIMNGTSNSVASTTTKSSVSSSPETTLPLSTTAELSVVATQTTTISDVVSSSETFADGTTTTQAVEDTTTTAFETTSATGLSVTTTEATTVSGDISSSVTLSDDTTTLLAITTTTQAVQDTTTTAPATTTTTAAAEPGECTFNVECEALNGGANPFCHVASEEPDFCVDENDSLLSVKPICVLGLCECSESTHQCAPRSDLQLCQSNAGCSAGAACQQGICVDQVACSGPDSCLANLDLCVLPGVCVCRNGVCALDG
ncbi:putative 4-hydroxy-2-oxoglutarate aldolase [Fusarium oxysporum f. sp. matthiolae]|nr:putative 4-hydroxy-2-oxoglutarate aldolase [Fusarium oxysporum f. sp. matthiolae]